MKKNLSIFLLVLLSAVLGPRPIFSFCLPPDPVVLVHDVTASYDENADQPVHISAKITNISSRSRDIPFTVFIHGQVVENSEIEDLGPGKTYHYVYDGPRQGYMIDGFKHRVVVRALQDDPFHKRNPARMDTILAIPRHGTAEVETSIDKVRYLGEYLVEIETSIKNNTDRVMTPGWSVSIMGTIDVHTVDHITLQPGDRETFSTTVDLETYQSSGFDLKKFGPFPVRVMSCAMGYCDAAFFVAEDLCDCVPEICGNGEDDDCNGLVDENCAAVQSVSKGFCHILEWQKQGHPGQFTHDQALDYCLSLEGSNAGWRLPTKNELKSLVVCTNGKETPLADGETCGSGYRFPTISSEFTCSMNRYWTDTAEDSSYWTVNFYTGASELLSKDSTANVRCVRTVEE